MTSLFLRHARGRTDIRIENSFSGLAPALLARLSRKPQTLLVVTHPSLQKLYGEKLARPLKGRGLRVRFASIPEGESSKDLKTVEKLYERCAAEGLDRASAIAALGGGVVGDVAGFVSATYLRGIALVQVPTTLLAMVDSSIGGKTGVDLPAAKNFVGAFHQPALVWANLETLTTLPEREFRNGLAEVIKYGVIRDGRLFGLLEKNIGSLRRNPVLLKEVIARCARIKARVVGADERETKGLREVLNFGHTWGHAIEAVTRYRGYKHGEAISIGMCAAGRMAEVAGLWKARERARLESLLLRAGLPIRLRERLPEAALLRILARDKKNLSGNLRFVLPVRMGRVIVRPVPASLALEGLRSVQPS